MIRVKGFIHMMRNQTNTICTTRVGNFDIPVLPVHCLLLTKLLIATVIGLCKEFGPSM